MDVALRLMTEHDLPMLHDWLHRPHVAAWWGGEDGRPTLEEVRRHYLPRVLAQESVTPYIATRGGQPIGYAQSYVALGSGDGWWEDQTDPGVRGVDQFLADPAMLNQGWGTRMVRSLVDLLFADPAVMALQTDPSPDNHRAIRCYEKAGFVGQGIITTPDGPALYMLQTRHRFEAARRAEAPSPLRAAAIAPPTLRPVNPPTSTVQAWIDAFNAADPEGILALYAPGAVLWGTFATELIQDREGLAAYFVQALQGTPPPTAAVHALVVQHLGTVAVASGACDLQVNQNGQRLSFRARFSMLLSPSGEHWRIVHHHSSILPQGARP